MRQEKSSLPVRGTVQASEQLIHDLYIDLRQKAHLWSQVTKQTPQARMGYVGQHLVSVVTGYPGGRSGARGHDLELRENKYGEIKTCYRVDQLGECKDCKQVVSGVEMECPACGSREIKRKDDSKWLISIRNDEMFRQILDPEVYYFVLFEYVDLNSIDNRDICASIYQVDPKEKGFVLALIQYYLCIRSKSKSKAPFNLWPHDLKFQLTCPKLIYQSIIAPDDTIQTRLFPGRDAPQEQSLFPLKRYAHSRTLTVDHIKTCLEKLGYRLEKKSMRKDELLEQLEKVAKSQGISNRDLCDMIAQIIYLPQISPYQKEIPKNLCRFL